MRRYNNYDKAKVITETERLPIGGYVCKILNVEYQDNSSRGYNDNIILSFDIAEGEYKDFYAKQYRNQQTEDKKWKGNFRMRCAEDDGSEQDGWTMNRFKTNIHAFEESNKGFTWNWEEQTLKGKLIGIVFNNKEWEMNGRSGFYTNAHHLVSVEDIRNGKFKIPADQLLENRNGGLSDEGFMDIPDSVDDDALPFN